MKRDIYSSSFRVKKRRRVVLCVFLLLLSLMLGVVAAVLRYFRYNHRPIDKADVGVIEKKQEEIINIALFGVDSRDMENISGLSDSVMVLSINSENKSIKMVSFMRDSLVKIEGYKKKRKLCEAYSLGGATLAIKTLNQNFGLDITEYASVNFAGLAAIIDSVGGITANITKREIEQVNGLTDEICSAMDIKSSHISSSGEQTLSGVQAVAWARIRKVPTAEGDIDDFGRTSRQRHVMNQLFEKALAINKTAYPRMIKSVLPYAETSLGFSEILSVAGILTKNPEFVQTRIPADEYIIDGDYYYGGVSTVYYNTDYAAQALHAFLYENISQQEYIAANPEDNIKN